MQQLISRLAIRQTSTSAIATWHLLAAIILDNVHADRRAQVVARIATFVDTTDYFIYGCLVVSRRIFQRIPYARPAAVTKDGYWRPGAPTIPCSHLPVFSF